MVVNKEGYRMKKFSTPVLEIQRLAPEDVFTNSCTVEALGCDSCYVTAGECDDTYVGCTGSKSAW